MNRSLDVTTSCAASVLRGGAGMSVRRAARQPEKPLELYEFEACPFCRRVREALTELDLDATIYPCPKGGRFRENVLRLGGKALFPLLVDPNAGKLLYESLDIVRHLYETYADASPPFTLGPLAIVSGGLASAVRGRGSVARASKVPAAPLLLWSVEASPYCRIVRERLSELSIPYKLVNVGTGSAKWPAFIARSGKQLVPYLEDPNTGVKMFESPAIAAYLERTYAS
jgi:glutathione S-transferase